MRILAAGAMLWALCAGAQHAADTALPEGQISLSELTRVVQLYNAGALRCDAQTEDGYAPGAGDTSSCDAHSSDYAPSDWAITLSELLRLVQLYNVGSYGCCQGDAGEDGFCLGDAGAGIHRHSAGPQPSGGGVWSGAGIGPKPGCDPRGSRRGHRGIGNGLRNHAGGSGIFPGGAVVDHLSKAGGVPVP